MMVFLQPDLQEAWNNDQGQIPANNHDFDYRDHHFQDTEDSLISHDSSSLLGRTLFGLPF